MHAFILEQKPLAFVSVQVSWPPTGSGLSLDERLWLVDPAFPRRHGLAYLLFDEGQNSYQDCFLWNEFFKAVGDGGYDCYRVILFCSCGSPSSRLVP